MSTVLKVLKTIALHALVVAVLLPAVFFYCSVVWILTIVFAPDLTMWYTRTVLRLLKLIAPVLLLTSCTTLLGTCYKGEVIYNDTPVWSEYDESQLVYARETGCRERFGDRSCMHIFTKLDYHRYTVACYQGQ